MWVEVFNLDERSFFKYAITERQGYSQCGPRCKSILFLVIVVVRVGDKLNRGSGKFIVQYSNVGPVLYAVCHIGECTFILSHYLTDRFLP